MIVGAKRHVTVTRALRLLGIGASQETIVPTHREGRMDVSAFAEVVDGNGPVEQHGLAEAGDLAQGHARYLGPVPRAANRPARTGLGRSAAPC